MTPLLPARTFDGFSVAKIKSLHGKLSTLEKLDSIREITSIIETD